MNWYDWYEWFRFKWIHVFWFIKLRFVHFFLLAAPGRCETDFRFGGQRRGLRRDAAVALDPKNLMVKIPWWKWRENFRLRSGKKHFYGNQGTGRKRPGLRSWHMSKKTFEREISLVFFRKNVGSSFHVGSILVGLWCGMYAMDLMDLMDLDSTCERDVGDVCLNVFLDWFMLICAPGGFQHKSWRLHHDEIILAVAQEERDSLGSSRVHFCRCVRLVSGAGTSCTWNEMMWTTCFSTFGHNSILQFKKIAEFQHTSGSLASLLGMCAFQVCRKQCCILHFRVRTWEIPASLTCQKLPKWCCNSYRHMYCSFIHPLFYCILGLFYKHRVPSLQVSNYRSSRAWCDQSNKIDRVRGAKRNWKSPRSILKFQSYNSLVRFAKPLSEGRSEVKLLAYNLKGAALRERRVQILKWLESRMWKD